MRSPIEGGVDMQKSLILCVYFLLLTPLVFAQSNEWSTQYVTFDDAINGTLNRTPSVAVVGPNDFVALVTRGSSAGGDLINYLVGYVNADSANGRLNDPQPTGGGVGSWEVLLDKVDLADAFQLAGGSDNLAYLANNDVNHNILVFELTATAVVSAPFRMETGAEDIWAIEVDANGYVYVCDANGDDTKTDEVKIYPPVTDPNATWETSHDSPPTGTIDLPPGEYRGITVSGDGSQVFVSQSSERKILKYTGSPSSGYITDSSFDLTLDPSDLGPPEVGAFVPTVLGLAYLEDPGVVFAAVDTLFFGGEEGGYRYGRIYVIDGATGANVDTIDVAQWNFDHAGDYSTGSNDGLWSGFTSTYDIDVEPTENNMLYSQSWYGWAVEKWVFDGDLGTIVSVEQVTANIPESFALKQNYPNPFNPSTTIEFALQQAEHVTLSIYNLLGHKVATLLNERLNPGTYKTVFDAGNLTSGVYFYTLQAGHFKSTKKLVLTK